MDRIADLLSVNRIYAQCRIEHKEALFEEAARLFENESSQLSRENVFHALMDREKLASTDIGKEVAIPHGRIKGLDKPLGVFFQLAFPLSFNEETKQSVRLVFVMLVPESANESHLQLLSELAQMFSDECFRKAVLDAKDTEIVMAEFEKWPKTD